MAKRTPGWSWCLNLTLDRQLGPGFLDVPSGGQAEATEPFGAVAVAGFLRQSGQAAGGLGGEPFGVLAVTGVITPLDWAQRCVGVSGVDGFLDEPRRSLEVVGR